VSLEPGAAEFVPLPQDKSVFYGDVNLLFTPKFGSIYLIEDEKLALVESGTSHTVSELVYGIKVLGFNTTDIDYLLLTHIHLDHAGGAGFLSRLMPNAKIVVHERGAKHLADPTRLLESARAALGGAYPSYGEMSPVPPERILSVRDDDVIELGKRRLRILYTPGHAPHHVSILDESNQTIYVGDSTGLFFPPVDRIIPITPMPNFDLDVAVGNMERMRDLKPQALLFSHFGPVGEPQRVFNEQIAAHRAWVAFVEERMSEKPEEKIAREAYEEFCAGITGYPREFIEEKAESTVRGILHYLRKKDAPQTG